MSNAESPYEMRYVTSHVLAADEGRQRWPLLAEATARMDPKALGFDIDFIAAEAQGGERSLLGHVGILWAGPAVFRSRSMLGLRANEYLPEIINLEVLEPYRRRGIGGALMEAAIERVRLCSYGRLCLHVATDNANAHRLHAGLGFAPIGAPQRLEHYVRNPAGKFVSVNKDTDLLIKNLSPAAFAKKKSRQ